LLDLFSKKIGSKNKVDQVLDYIVREYVDTLYKDTLTDKTIELLLSNLDPHSAYIPAKNLAETNEPLQGNFEGVGIEFSLLNDTIYVVNVIADGPSEVAGIKKGDRIIQVNGKTVAGIKITNENVLKTL
jgi:carboxyl-terminal processing protease